MTAPTAAHSISSADGASKMVDVDNKTLAGALTGNVTGNITGNVTGTLNGPFTDKAFAADGAIDITMGLARLTKAGVNAMTLANPAAGDTGKILIITAQTANAHTVTCTGGFAGAGSGADVATFGGAIGDNMALIACNLLWHVLSLRNVTLG